MVLPWGGSSGLWRRPSRGWAPFLLRCFSTGGPSSRCLPRGCLSSNLARFPWWWENQKVSPSQCVPSPRGGAPIYYPRGGRFPPLRAPPPLGGNYFVPRPPLPGRGSPPKIPPGPPEGPQVLRQPPFAPGLGSLLPGVPRAPHLFSGPRVQTREVCAPLPRILSLATRAPRFPRPRRIGPNPPNVTQPPGVLNPISRAPPVEGPLAGRRGNPIPWNGPARPERTGRSSQAKSPGEGKTRPNSGGAPNQGPKAQPGVNLGKKPPTPGVQCPRLRAPRFAQYTGIPTPPNSAPN